MARILNIEKSEYINQNIEAYASSRVGQYSKYLDKNPLFLTWFHVNEAHTRSDTGSGGIHSEIGPMSPVRYTQINGLPVYGIPSELKPQAEYDQENGNDIELEISDAWLLPGTIKPAMGDYFLLKLPGTKEFLFSVNSFEYNTIQSNDFYMFSANVRNIGENLIDTIKPQVVEEWETIFENIGTEDKCFIRTKDVDMVNNIGKLFLELREDYRNNFFDKETGCFVCKNNDISKDDSWYYDVYVEKFIMDSKLFFDSFDTESIMLASSQMSSVPTPELTHLYNRTLFYAIKHGDMTHLATHPYYYLVEVTRRLSPFVVNHINCKGVNLEIMNRELVEGHSDGLDSGMLKEYFSHLLLSLLKGEELQTEHCKLHPIEHEVEIEDTPSDTEEVFGHEVEIEDEDAEVSEPEIPEETPEPEEEDPTAGLTQMEKLIYEFGVGLKPVIKREDLVQYSFRVDPETYRTLPIILYILKKYYDSFFEKYEK